MPSLLIADDHPLFRAALRQAARDALGDVELLEAGDLDGVLATLDAQPQVDLVLLDLHMPGNHGLAGLAAVRAQHPGVAVIVVSAIDALSVMPEAVGKTYALTDPQAPTVRRMVDEFCRLLDRDPHWVRVPLRLSRTVVGMPFVEQLLGFPEEALAYFAHPTIYDTTHATTDLATVGLSCPSFLDYAPNMIDFVRAHPDVSSQAMV